MVNSA